ncbi:MAG: bifunctional transaldolase/phosoglucose isomerase [Acidimicrobiia bacterium]
MSNLHEISAQGQSIWLDELRRAWLASGELERMMREDALTGMTSNPTIFAKAISGSTDYDEQLRRLVEEGADTKDLYVTLVTEDIQVACDILRPAWEETGGTDGFVSIEVSPGVAYDTAATIDEVRAWHKRIARPNCLVKVPATPAGLPVIEQMIGEGLSINVTLTFGLDRYREVASAYLAGLERLLGQGGDPSSIFSVASFFVSRVDSEVDRRLDDLAGDAEGARREELLALRGKAGIANARAAYGIFQETFSGDRWERLAGRGARVQKVLWASTSVKDPAYRDTMYVEELVAPETVNTMPVSTIRAFQDHGDPGAGPFGRSEIEEARRTLDRLAEVGIDYQDVTDVLEREGVEKFADSFEELMDCLETSRRALSQSGWQLHNLEDEAPGGLAAKIWTKDASAWGEGEDDPAERLGWLELPEKMDDQVRRLQAFAKRVVEDGIRHVVLLGMGGSSLAPEMFMEVFGSAREHPSLAVLDSTHPERIRAVAQGIDPDKSLFLVSSKSGTTTETISLYRYFRSQIDDGRHFVAITDPGSPLEGLAGEEGFRATFTNPPDIGGRYSALSYFGLVPAALIGADLEAVLSAGHRSMNAAERCVPDGHNPGLVIGAAIARLAKQGRDKLTFLISEPIASFGSWVEQLVAESTGKRGTGIVPIVGEPQVDPERYGADRAFVHIRLDGDRSQDGFVESLVEAGHPLIAVRVPDPAGIGAEIYRWEFAIAVAGAELGINPFDQPDVESAKRTTREILEEAEEIEWAEEDPAHLFEGLEPPEYVAVLAFVAPTDEHLTTIAAARRRLLLEHEVASMGSFGPRYLHSTGQLHKGGPPRLRALVVFDRPSDDLAIPGRDYGFAHLIAAQAEGDAHALRQAGRRVARTTWERFEAWATR